MAVVLTVDEFLQKGLELVGYNYDQQQKVARAANLMRFKVHYGSNPIMYAQIWEDLQTTMIPEACIDSRKTDPDSFLMAIHFLAHYLTNQEQTGIFKICDKTAHSWSWFYARKIQALKGEKVSIVLTALFSERYDF